MTTSKHHLHFSICNAIVTFVIPFLLLPIIPIASGDTGKISGRITDSASGEGISGASVSAVGPSHNSTTTDSNGYYTISGLVPGPYAITASAYGYVEKSFSSFIYPTGTTTLNFQLVMPSIKGRVYDASTPAFGIAEANLTIDEEYLSTNASGYYEWLGLPANTYTLTASAPGYAGQSQQVTVSTGNTVTADFGLNPVASGEIAGTVTDSTTGNGVSGATVRVVRGSFEKTDSTDLNGQYSIENVPAWSYWTVDAYKIGYITETSPSSVQSGATTTLNFELILYGNISGTVKDQSTNQPIEGAIVKRDSAFFDTTNSNGYYTMFAEPDSYNVTASAPGYSTQSELNVQVFAGETTTLNFLLQSVPPGKIVGSVTDSKTMLGIAGALVTADGHSNFTDADGDYNLSNVPAWSYTISVSAAGYVSSSALRNLPSGGLATVNFPLTPDTRVSVEPYLSFGSPGQSLSFDLVILDSRFVYNWEIYLWWNPALLESTDFVEGSFLKGPFGNRTTQFSSDEYVNEGVIHAKCLSALSPADSGVSGSGTLATLTFLIKAKGSCKIDITNALLFSPPPSMPVLPRALEDAVFRTLKSDVNNDGTVNILDLAGVKQAYGSSPLDARWNASADVNRDHIINVSDLHKLGKDYGLSI